MLYWDEDRQEWVEDDTAEPRQPSDLPEVIYQSPDFEQDQTPIPPRPPIMDSLLGGSYAGPREGVLSDKYRARQMARAEMPPPVSFGDAPIGGYGAPDAGSGPYNPETSAMITGYGKNLMLRKAGNPTEKDWLDVSGNPASPEYIMDIVDTIKARDSGTMSETQLKEKIAGQEGRPPGRRPTDGEVNIVDFVNYHMNDAEPKLREQARAARKQWEGTVAYSTRALNEAAFDSKGAALEEKMYNELRNEEKMLATKHAERLQRLEDAKRNQPQSTEWGLRERAANGDLTAIAALKVNEGEKQAENTLKREMSEKDLYKPLINNLPKTKDEAVQANIRVGKYKHLYSMAEKGAGGLVPGLKGMLAPIAEAIGSSQETVKDMSEAQVYQLMARAAVGSQRLMLVGSGQVSNYEQELMQRLSGGSIKVSREAAKELFKFYIKESEGLVGAYNTQIDSISEKFPDVKKMYGHVGKGDAQGGSAKPRLTPQQALEELRRRGKL